jgi:uncharacterized protein (DUF1778 family)
MTTVCRAFDVDKLKRQIAHAAMVQAERRAAGDVVGAAGALGEMQHAQGQLVELLKAPPEPGPSKPAQGLQKFSTVEQPLRGRVIG